MHLQQLLAVQHLAQERYGKDGLNTAGCSGDNADGACRGDGGGSGIAHLGCLRGVINGTSIVGKVAAPLGQVRGGSLGFPLDKRHYLLSHLNGRLGIVGNSKSDQ